MITSEEERAILLHSAREAILSIFDYEVKIPLIDFKFYPGLIRKNAGAFVTLTKKGKLRGCVGYISSTKSLYDTVIDAAQNSAINDPRFTPVTSDEVSQLDIEVSVLSPPMNIDGYDKIVLGKHGLILDDDHYKAVLLPQVALEHKFSISEFLSALCEKAGLERNAWTDYILNIKVFTAEVISEIGNRIRTYEGI